MSRPPHTAFTLSEFEVAPSDNAIRSPRGTRFISAAEMAVLVRLAEQSGSFVSEAELSRMLTQVEETSGETLTDCVRALKHSLGDAEADVVSIEHDDELGYRLRVAARDSGDYVFETDSGPIHARRLDGPDEGDFLLQTSSGPVILHPVPEYKAGEWRALLAELRRRRVFRALAAYAVMAWLILQIADVLFGALPVPDWTLTATVLVLAAGFPIVAVFAWVFQLTSTEISPDSEHGDIEIDRSRLVRQFDLLVIAVLLIVVAVLSYGRVFPALPTEQEVTVAVLAFENLSSDADNFYLSEGIADDIRARLHDVPQLLVAARMSSRSLSGKGFDAATIGERLGVEHILEGTLRRVGNRIRLNVQLVDVESGFHRWNRVYDTTMEDMLDLQQKISLVVASELSLVLTRELREALAENVTDDPVAFDDYLRARSYLDRPRSSDNLAQALMLFKEAIARDSGFALGYAGLCQTFIASFRYNGDTRYIEQAETACHRALSFDPRLNQVHTALGELHLLSGELDEAEIFFSNAVQIDPRSVDAYSGLGDVFTEQGQLAAAELQYEKAIALQPGNWNGYNRYARFLFQAGRYAEAASNYQRAIELAPDNAHGYNNLGVTYYVLGKFQEAAEAYRQSLELEPGRAAYSNTGSMYYFAGDYVQAAAMFRRAAEEAATDYRLWGNLADAQRFTDDAANADATYLRAIELAEAQLRINPRDAATLTNLAWYRANRGELDAAAERLVAAQALSPSDAAQQYVAALVYTVLEQPARARQAIENALASGFPKAMLEATPEFKYQVFPHLKIRGEKDATNSKN